MQSNKYRERVLPRYLAIRENEGKIRTSVELELELSVLETNLAMCAIPLKNPSVFPPNSPGVSSVWLCGVDWTHPPKASGFF